MAKNTNPLTAFAGHFSSVSQRFDKRLVTKGTSSIEGFAMLVKEENIGLVDEFADHVAGLVLPTKSVAASVVSPAIQSTPKLLRRLTSTTPVANPFRVSDTFLNKKNGRVRIFDWGTNFEQFFSGKEETAPPTPLQVSVLEQTASDEEIVADLGGKEAAKITMTSLWEQIALQGQSKSGDLRTDGWANIAYIEDTNGVLWTVHAGWFSDGWCFYACRFPHPRRWGAGNRVVSPRNS